MEGDSLEENSTNPRSILGVVLRGARWALFIPGGVVLGGVGAALMVGFAKFGYHGDGLGEFSVALFGAVASGYMPVVAGAAIAPCRDKSIPAAVVGTLILLAGGYGAIGNAIHDHWWAAGRCAAMACVAMATVVWCVKNDDLDWSQSELFP